MSVERSELKVERSAPPGAVFISYAREDSDAARRIADALRAFGVEVWFDQNELRGGDTWDAKIKQQIRECALFVPVISQHTQERTEGYFRREWKLGVERTHDMASNRAFLAPVVIDDTKETQANVPEEFLRVQWTRLAHGVPSPQFVEQIKRLLTPTSRATGATSLEPGRPRPAARDEGAAAPGKTGKRVAVAALAILALGVGIFFALRPPSAKSPPTLAASDATTASAPPAPITAKPPLDLAAAKSIAVLPFVNRSADSGDAFFSDGMHEDILTNLSRIRELQVKSRTSVEQYRATTKPMPQIGRELGVAYILEGSVQRAGTTVRITGQLINAATDEHLWAQSYDRELTTANLFAIQSELAQAIAREMKAAISPEEKKLLARRPTENLAAYDLFLKARAERVRNIRTPAALDQLEILYQAPVTLDPNFALAWCELSWVHGYKYFFNVDHTAARLAKARVAIDHAVRLAPDAPETILNLGYFHYFCLSDYARALEHFGRLVRQEPNNDVALYALALIHRRTARWPEALENFRKAAELDPALPGRWNLFGNLLLAGRRYDEAAAAMRRLAALGGGNEQQLYVNPAAISFFARGSKLEMEAYFSNLPAGAALQERFNWAVWTGDLKGAVRLDQLRPDRGAARAEMMAIILAAQGDLVAARARLRSFPDEMRSRLQGSEAENSPLWGTLGRIEAILGNKDEALRYARKAVELVPESVDSFTGPGRAADLAFVYAWTGDKDRAIAEYGRLLRTPVPSTSGILSVHRMRSDPRYFPLHGDPRFEALLKDPRNNAPLF